MVKLQTSISRSCSARGICVSPTRPSNQYQPDWDLYAGIARNNYRLYKHEGTQTLTSFVELLVDQVIENLFQILPATPE